MLKNRLKFTAVIFALALGTHAFAGETTKTTANVDPKTGVILGGYDPVSYFKAGKPTLGKPELSADLEGVKYQFTSAENRKEFLKDPKHYVPAYEGWCATAVAKGTKYKIDPLNYKVTDGRLFLFYHESGLFGGDAKPDWIKNEPEKIKQADANWPKVRLKKEE
jgi:YHS domain-containing protein